MEGHLSRYLKNYCGLVLIELVTPIETADFLCPAWGLQGSYNPN